MTKRNVLGVVATAVGILTIVGCGDAGGTADELLPTGGGAETAEPAPGMPKDDSAAKYGGTADLTETTTSANGQSYAQPVPYKLSAGIFAVGGGLYYSNGNDAFCAFASWPDYVEGTGRAEIYGVPFYPGGPVGMRYDGGCRINFRPGFFNYGQTFYSNGSAFCACDRSSPPARGVHRRPDSPFHGSCGGC